MGSALVISPALCARYGVSCKTGYKWIKRFEEAGLDGLKDQSRRPHHSPNQIPEEATELLLALGRSGIFSLWEVMRRSESR